MMADDQHYFERLRAADPAVGDRAGDLGVLKARVIAQTDTQSNVVAFTPRSPRLRMWRYAAAAAVVALAAGLGFAGGVTRQSSSPSTAAFAPALGLGGGVPSAAVGKAAASSIAGYGFYGGGVILQPAAGMPNTAGTASAYRLTADGIDLHALVAQVAAAVGMAPTQSAAQQEGSSTNLAITSANGMQGANVWVNGGMVSVSGYDNARSPWGCQKGVPEGTTSSPAAQVPAVTATASCSQTEPAPVALAAIALVRKAFHALGMDPLGAGVYRATSMGSDGSEQSPTIVNVTMTPMVEGQPVPGAGDFTASVSAAGIYSINGWIPRTMAIGDYPIDGAADVAKRTLSMKWQALGAQWVMNPLTKEAVMATPGASASSTAATPPTPTAPQLEGKPMVSAYTSSYGVTHAQHALQLRFLVDGSAVLMPAWLYLDDKGDGWTMLAIAERFIDWRDQPTGGPVAYDAAVASGVGGSAAASATAPAPMK